MAIRWRREAADDQGRIHDYIAEANAPAARSVVGRVLHAVERLETFPASGRSGSAKDTREVVIPGLPYIVVYRLLAQDVEVIAVFHAAQDRG